MWFLIYLNLSAGFESVSFVWIPREKNLIADSLAKSAMSISELPVVGLAVNTPN